MDNTKKSSGSSRVGILDELRGFAIICMVVYHAMYDLKYLFGLDIPIFFDGWFDVIRDIFAGLFIFISGTVCRYSSNNIKRGAQCFFIGMIMTFVMPFFTSGTVMFGILHFLGVSMMLFGLGQKLFDLLPSWVGIGVCVLLFILTMNVRLTYANGMISPGYIGIPNLFAIKLPMEAYNVGVLFPLLYFLRPNTSKLRLVRTKLELQPILNACGNGSSELMSNISSSIVSMVYNFQLLKYLGEDGVSAYGVLMYVQFVFVAIYIGYSIGCAPIVGFHYGAQNHPELKNMLRMSVILMSASGVVLTVLARVLAAPLAKIFVGYDEGLFTLTCHAFRLFSFAFLFAGFNIFASSFFTALGNGLISAAISFLRTLVFQTSSVILLPLLLGVDGIWYAITVAEVFATLISVIFLFAKRKKYHYMECSPHGKK